MNITIYIDDNRNILPLLGKFDIIFLDGPYFLPKRTKVKHGDKVVEHDGSWDTFESIDEFVDYYVDLLMRVENYNTRPETDIVIFGLKQNVTRLIPLVEKLDFKYDLLVWRNTNRYMCFALGWKHIFEMMIHASKSTLQTNTKLTSSAERADVLTHNWKIKESVGVFRDQKPLALMDHLLRTLIKDDGAYTNILDPFLGTGTSLIVSVKSPEIGEFIGIERDKKLVEEVVLPRLRKAVAQEDMFRQKLCITIKEKNDERIISM